MILDRVPVHRDRPIRDAVPREVGLHPPAAGRAHPGGSQALFGIKADLGCYGKVIGGRFCTDAANNHIDFLWSPTGSWSGRARACSS